MVLQELMKLKHIILTSSEFMFMKVEKALLVHSTTNLYKLLKHHSFLVVNCKINHYRFILEATKTLQVSVSYLICE